MTLRSLDCDILTSDAEVEALEAEWRELQERAGKSIFTDYDWFAAWRNSVGHNGGRILHIITGRSDGRLVALLPLAVVVRKGFRRMQYIGEEPFFQSDILLENDAYAQQLWQVARRSPHYDFAHIRDVAPLSVNIKALKSFACLHDRFNENLLRIEWKTGEEWKATLSKQFRRNIDKSLRLLSEKGKVSFELCETTPVPEGIIEGMVQHKTAWCAEHNHWGIFNQPNILSFYQALAKVGAQREKLALAWLKCDDSVIAYHLMYKYKKTIYSYVMATDAAWLKYSPGNLAHYFAITWAIENGFELFNHMQGDFAYKAKFSNEIRECNEYTFSKSLRGWFGAQLFIKRRALQCWLASNKVKALKKRLRGNKNSVQQPSTEN